MIDLIIKEICSDVASGLFTEVSLSRLLNSNTVLYSKLLNVELKVISDIRDMKKCKGRDEYEKYNLASGIIKAEEWLLGIQDKIIIMENTIIALQGLLGEKVPLITITKDAPVLSYQISPSRILLEESKKLFESSKTQ